MRRALYVGLVSAAALAFEVQLLHLLAFQHWHAFAALIIGLALLGYAASGTLLAVAEARGFQPGHGSLRLAASTLAVSIPLSSAAAQRVPFNALEWIWDPMQVVWMTLMLGGLGLPFLAAGAAIVMAFRMRTERVSTLYAGDLVGASMGAALAALVLVRKPPDLSMALCAGLALIAVCVAGQRFRPGRSGLVATAVVAAVALAGEPHWRLSPYKGQARALTVDGARLIDQQSTRHGILATVDNPRIPPRFAPGMSLLRGAEPPRQLLVFLDGDQASTIDAPSPDSSYLTETVAATADHLAQAPLSVVLAGVGTGLELRRAQAMEAASIIAIDRFAERIDLLRDRHADFAGRPLDAENVRVMIGDPRRIVPKLATAVDRVVLAGADSLAAAASGVGSLQADYAITVEAWISALQALRPAGLAVWTGWVQLPPRRVPKQLMTVREALFALGATDPYRHVIVVRDWSVATLIVSPQPLDPALEETLARWVDSRGFDRVCDPWMTPDQANRHHRWRQPLLHEACVNLLGPDFSGFLDRYRFDLRAARDDRPFPAHTFRPGLLVELGRPAGGAILLESGALTQWAALVSGLAVSLLLVGAPMAVRGIRWGPRGWAVALYFLAIGLGFLFLEIGLLLKASLWLGQPADAFALTLVALLVGAGLGSRASSRAVARWGLLPCLGHGTGAISVSVVLLAGFGTAIDRALLSLPVATAAALTALAFITLGYAMGRFLPAALDRVLAERPGALPWCWAFNGVASVLASAASLLIAASFGIRALLLTGVICYALALAAGRIGLARSGS